MEIDNQDDHATAPGTPDSESDTDVDLRELFVVKITNKTFLFKNYSHLTELISYSETC